MGENAENGWKCWKVAYYFKKIIKLTYLPAFSAFVSNFYHLQTFSAVAFQHFQHWSAIFSYFQQFQPFSAFGLSGQIYVVLWIKYYVLNPRRPRPAFSNTCKKCLNMFYDFKIILKSAQQSRRNFFGASPPPRSTGTCFIVCVLTGRGKAG